VELSREWNGCFPVVERRHRNVWMHRAHIANVMNRLRDSGSCGMPLALTNCMNHQTLKNNQSESTYALLVRSEEKGRGVLETVLYVAFILSAIVLIWEFVQSPVSIEAVGLEQSTVSQSARPHVVSRS
jgi:hypothetical protein